LNKVPLNTIHLGERIAKDNNAFIFNKLDPVRQLDSKITYSHYDTSLSSFNRRAIDKEARLTESLPQSKNYNKIK